MLHFSFEEASVLTGLFFKAINEGVLEEKREGKINDEVESD